MDIIQDYNERSYNDYNLPINSSRSELFMNEGKVMNLNSERSQRSVNYRE